MMMLNSTKTFVRRAVVLLVVALTLTPAEANAQSSPSAGWSASAGAGWGALWDDETHLGRGVPIAGGVALTMAGRLVVGGDIDWTAHVRDSGYLRTEGRLTGLFARATYVFGTPGATIRPLIGAGMGAVHSSGTLIMRSTVFGPSGQPTQGPEERTSWTQTHPAAELHGGLQFPLSDRLSLRSEARWRTTLGRSASTVLEPPLLGIQGMVHLDVGL